MKTVEILITGKVQGVGFRACVRRIAVNLGVCGEVMNLKDGRVRIIATAEPAMLEKFISMLYSCSRVIIRELQTIEKERTDFRGFSIVRETQ
ncbi:acylphosphatase [Methanothrix sp.]|uniref:acylphosphatase n=1 Tax=Methanothrix sp. TaxID=90426 RepID=UPI0034E1F3F7